jgi:outer membrane protein OmpA-like peptidoglycan-associated protein
MMTGKSTVAFTAALATAIMSGGCATKKHVREAIAPVQQQVNVVQKQANDNKTAIGDLDRQVSTADEKATDAGKRAGQAMDAANTANQAAMQAGQRADAANSAAQQAQSGVARLDRTLQNLDNYKLVDTKQVFFRTGRYTLDKDAQAGLDNALQSLGSMHSYVIEIEGFADKTGNKAMNLELSKKRADAVVRYLTVDHNVPLRDIRQLGVGSEFPNAVNKTRADRKENRRVDVKVYALDMTGGQASTTARTGSQNTADRTRQNPQQ